MDKIIDKSLKEVEDLINKFKQRLANLDDNITSQLNQILKDEGITETRKNRKKIEKIKINTIKKYRDIYEKEIDKLIETKIQLEC